jgi:hypothetical protein
MLNTTLGLCRKGRDMSKANSVCRDFLKIFLWSWLFWYIFLVVIF